MGLMFYIDQLHTPSFPVRLLKTESSFIVRSVETGLGRWRLVVVVISVDAYSFFGFLRPGLSPWGYGNRCFLIALCCLIVRRPNLEVATKTSPSAGKNTGVVLVPCSHMKKRSYSYFQWCGYFWGPWVSFVTTDEFSVRVTKITSRIGVSWTHSLPSYF